MKFVRLFTTTQDPHFPFLYWIVLFWLLKNVNRKISIDWIPWNQNFWAEVTTALSPIISETYIAQPTFVTYYNKLTKFSCLLNHLAVKRYFKTVPFIKNTKIKIFRTRNASDSRRKPILNRNLFLFCSIRFPWWVLVERDKILKNKVCFITRFNDEQYWAGLLCRWRYIQGTLKFYFQVLMLYLGKR